MNKFTNKFLALGALVGTTVVALVSPDLLESLIKNLSEVGQTQFARDCFIFSLAAMIHAGRMKKEIRANFESLTISIDKVSAAFREDLSAHRERLDTHGEKLDNLSNRVSSLESKTTQPLKEK